MEKTEDRQSLQKVREDLEELDKMENNNCKKFKNLAIIRLDSLSWWGGGGSEVCRKRHFTSKYYCCTKDFWRSHLTLFRKPQRTVNQTLNAKPRPDRWSHNLFPLLTFPPVDLENAS